VALQVLSSSYTVPEHSLTRYSFKICREKGNPVDASNLLQSLETKKPSAEASNAQQTF